MRFNILEQAGLVRLRYAFLVTLVLFALLDLGLHFLGLEDRPHLILRNEDRSNDFNEYMFEQMRVTKDRPVIVVFGASVMQGLINTTPDTTMSARLEALLAEAGRPALVLNMAVVGNNLGDTLALAAESIRSGAALLLIPLHFKLFSGEGTLNRMIIHKDNAFYLRNRKDFKLLRRTILHVPDWDWYEIWLRKSLERPWAFFRQRKLISLCLAGDSAPLPRALFNKIGIRSPMLRALLKKELVPSERNKDNLWRDRPEYYHNTNRKAYSMVFVDENDIHFQTLKLINELPQGRGVKMMFFLNPLNRKANNLYNYFDWGKHEKFTVLTRMMAREHGNLFVDATDMVDNRYFTDGDHITMNGHDQLARALLPRVLEALGETVNIFTFLFVLFIILLFAVNRFLIKAAWRHGLMTLVAVAFILTQDVSHWSIRLLFVAITFATLYIGWAHGNRIARADEARKGRMVLTGAAFLLAPLFLFKLIQVIAPPPLMESLLARRGDEDVVVLAPLGVSYFTFRVIAYFVEIRRGAVAPVSWRRFLNYVAFWPTLLAGPIERPGPFLAQTEKDQRATAEDVRIGMTRIFLGLFKKLVLADIFNTLAKPYIMLATASGMELEKWPVWYLWVCVHAYYLYLYCDFAGYSDVAIGLARLFGYRIMDNFRWPILAENVSDFWRRWHISLTSWITDYVYIPLGGNRVGPAKAARNTVIAMSLVGLWHGLTAHFIIWGIYHGLFLNLNRRLRAKAGPNPAPRTRARRLVAWFVTFQIVNLGWVLFLFSVHRALSIYARLFGFGG